MNTAIPQDELEELVITNDGESDAETVDGERDHDPDERLPYSTAGNPDRAGARERDRGDTGRRRQAVAESHRIARRFGAGRVG